MLNKQNDPKEVKQAETRPVGFNRLEVPSSRGFLTHGHELDEITIEHGSGGKLAHRLINDIFMRLLSNDLLIKQNDSACFDLPAGRIAFTTDSYVISPIFFSGGDIGRLSVAGTVNDLAVAGAKPLYLSCGFIIEEGFPIKDLERIVSSMADTCRECGVKIITGDTKVVPRGAADKIFINTSGVGVLHDGIDIDGKNAKPGDQIIISGTIGDHGTAILLEREKLNISADIKSDCAPLSRMIENVIKATKDIHVMRDPTRGGLATTLNEIAGTSDVAIELYEHTLPIKQTVKGVTELLGLDPLYIANEGKVVMVIPPDSSEKVLSALREHPYGKDACIIGEVKDLPRKRVFIKTIAGGSRVLDMLVGEQLPRIC